MSLRVFLFAKKMKFFTKGGIHCISQVFPWNFYFMREHSLVELTEHDDSAANIIVHGMYTYMYCCIHSVCVCVFSSHLFWTSSSLDVPPAGVTQEEGHTGFFIHLLSAVRALIFLARRIQPFLSLVDREVEFCVLTI